MTNATDYQQNLGLPDDKVKLLRKCLTHFSRIFTTPRSHEVYAVSWDVQSQPGPPLDLRGVLPPANWEEPDLIVFGLRRVPDLQAAEQWSAAFARAVAAYSYEFIKVETSPPVTIFHNGNQLLVFARETISRFVKSVGVTRIGGSMNAVAMRLVLHQSPVCLLAGRYSDDALPSPPPADISADAVAGHLQAVEALKSQEFASLVQRTRFEGDGSTHGLEDHAVAIFLGCRDWGLGSDLAKQKIQHIDFRVNKFVGDASLGAVTKFRGEAEALKAGILKLNLGGNERAAVEVCVLRLSLPTVDIEKMRILYRSAWKSLKHNEKASASLELEPQVINSEAPLCASTPHVFKFRVTNPHRLPVSFSIMCLSDSKKQIIPVAKHSLLHIEKTASSSAAPTPAKNEMLTPRAIESEDMGFADPTPKSPSRYKSFFDKIRGKTARQSTLPKERFSSQHLLQLSSQIHSGSIDRGSLVSPRSPSASAMTPRSPRAHEDLLPSPRTPMTTTPEDDAPDYAGEIPIPPSLPKVPKIEVPSRGVPADDAPPSPESVMDISKWIYVHPDQGVVLVGNSVEVTLTIHVKKGIRRHLDAHPLILVIRLDDSQFDQFFCFNCSLRPSMLCLTLNQLHEFRFQPVMTTREVLPILLPHEKAPVVVRPKNGKALDAPPKESDDDGTAEGGKDDVATRVDALAVDYPDIKKSLPMPKELWWIVLHIGNLIRKSKCSFSLANFLKSSLAVSREKDAQMKRKISGVISSVESGAEIPDDCSADAALGVLEDWALNLPVALVPRHFLAPLHEDELHMVCRAVLLGLPMLARNVTLSFISMMKLLIDVEMSHYTASSSPAVCAAIRRPLTVASAEWLARMMLKDTPTLEGREFVLHFLGEEGRSS